MAKNAPPKKPRNPQSAETQSVSAPIVGTGWKAFFRRPATISVILAAITFAVFSPALLADFVNYDDADYASANRHVQSGLSWENIRWAFTTGHASNWHPVTWLSHMLDCQLFGTGPKAMHGMNIGFHALNAVLLFVILPGTRFTLNRSLGFPSARMCSARSSCSSHSERTHGTSDRRQTA